MEETKDNIQKWNVAGRNVDVWLMDDLGETAEVSPYSNVNAELGITEQERRDQVVRGIRQMLDGMATIETYAPYSKNLPTANTCVLCFAEANPAIPLLEDYGPKVCKACWAEAYNPGPFPPIAA